MRNHTPGPWVFEAGICSILDAKERRQIAELPYEGSYISDEEYEFNGRLIAAAPELYDAVFALLNYAYELCEYAGGEEETRGRAPRILKEIREYEALLRRINGEEECQNEK